MKELLFAILISIGATYLGIADIIPFGVQLALMILALVYQKQAYQLITMKEDHVNN